MGSPLITANVFTGFLINNEACSLTSKGFQLNYHSVYVYYHFFQEAFTEEPIANDLPTFIANVMTLNASNNNELTFLSGAALEQL
jgi:hypothetical protein